VLGSLLFCRQQQQQQHYFEADMVKYGLLQHTLHACVIACGAPWPKATSVNSSTSQPP
jgi:hypothetical protein